jgi:hypothetical protein
MMNMQLKRWLRLLPIAMLIAGVMLGLEAVQVAHASIAKPPNPTAPPGDDTSEGEVTADGLKVGDHCVQVTVAPGALPVGSRVEVNSDPIESEAHVGSFQLNHSDAPLRFTVKVWGPDGAPITEFSPPLLVQARPCNGREGTVLFDWSDNTRMWRERPTRVQDGWYTTDWNGDPLY